ncbi:MAG TPA: GIY-YIG nuclease family protein, partial [Armatimonadota bacterium]|nr:GIY-YIG nuclease family protein [Armatimonadota bacterium]
GSPALHRDKTRLRKRLSELPGSPGIYRFYDINGSVIYVGKSVSLRDRVRSSFSGRATTKKLRRLRQEIVSLDWEETGSELEALLLESRLIKRLQPRFNVMLRGFVPLPYVRVDLQDPFPRLEVTRSPQRDGASYFGPFRSQAVLEDAVGALADALQLRNCPIPGTQITRQRPCYRHEFGTCSAPCLGLVQGEEYRRAVESACSVFEGREQTALRVLNARMERAAERLQFEIAARFRDVIRHIQSLGGRQQALISATQELSLVAACPSRKSDSLCLFVLRCGRLVFQEDVPRTELQVSRARREWTRRLLATEAPAPQADASQIDSALLDEIQIVTGWMKQKTREGDYWRFPAGGSTAEM